MCVNPNLGECILYDHARDSANMHERTLLNKDDFYGYGIVRAVPLTMCTETTVRDRS